MTATSFNWNKKPTLYVYTDLNILKFFFFINRCYKISSILCSSIYLQLADPGQWLCLVLFVRHSGPS